MPKSRDSASEPSREQPKENILASIHRVLSEEEEAENNPAASAASSLHRDKVTAKTLVAPETEAAAASSVGQLMRTVRSERSAVQHSGPTLEDRVREELRPVIKKWLDANLPTLAERLVRAEIERVVSQAAL